MESSFIMEIAAIPSNDVESNMEEDGGKFISNPLFDNLECLIILLPLILLEEDGSDDDVAIVGGICCGMFAILLAV